MKNNPLKEIAANSGRVLRVASIQLAVRETKQANLDQAAQCIRQAKDAGLVILPELWNIGFMSFDRYIPEAETQDGPTLTLLKALAVEKGCYLHTGSFVERIGDRYFNSSFLLSPSGEVLANYKKIHLFGYDSQEQNILSAGDQPAVAQTPFGRIGMATCYDLRFPEMFRKLVDLGAEIFLVCSAWPYPRLEHWLLLNQVRALENLAFLVSANSVGPNGNGVFLGRSMAVDPWGTVLEQGPAGEEAVMEVALDVGEVAETRDRFPALRDRR